MAKTQGHGKVPLANGLRTIEAFQEAAQLRI
jgi:hypothetical protein